MAGPKRCEHYAGDESPAVLELILTILLPELRAMCRDGIALPEDLWLLGCATTLQATFWLCSDYKKKG